MRAAGGEWGAAVRRDEPTELVVRSGPGERFGSGEWFGPGEQLGSAERFERSARFWMRAYPRRWRVARGEELLGLLLDLAAPGTRRVGSRTALNLLVGGWATRWREHPPFVEWMRYRTMDRPLQREHRAWAKDDIDGLGHGPRQVMFTPVLWLNMGIAMASGSRLTPVWLAVVPTAIFLALLFTTFGDRRKQVLKHVAPQPGERLYEGRLAVQDGPRVRTDARSGLQWLAAATGLLALGSLVTVFVAPLGWWADRVPRGPGVDGGIASGVGPVIDRTPAFLVLLVGVIAAVVAVRRVRRWLARPVDQPLRVLRRIGPLGATRTLVLVTIGAVPMWFELTGRIVMLVSPILGAVSVVLFAAAVAGMVHLRRPGGPPIDVALVDVLRAAILDRAAKEDGPVPELGPVGSAVPYDAAPPHFLGSGRYPVIPA